MKLKGLWLLAAAVCIGCSGQRGQQVTAGDGNGRAVAVKTVKVTLSQKALTKDYVGTIEEEDGVNLTFSSIGTVQRVMVSEGQFVRKDQPLAELDGNNIRNAYDMTKATLDQAEDAYRRLKNLYDKGTLPEIKMVEMETQLQKARSAEAISRKSLHDIVMRAPWSGYVAKIDVHEGANVMTGVSGLRLVKIDHVKVVVPVPEREIGKVGVGSSVTFSIAALGDRVFTGKVVSRGLTANPISHAYDVRALVNNADHVLLPGMVAVVKMEIPATTYRIVIPQQAVLISGHDKFVWIVKGNRAVRRTVTTGDITNEGVVVESGLSHGETVIVEGQEKVSEGVSVNAQSTAQPAGHLPEQESKNDTI